MIASSAEWRERVEADLEYIIDRYASVKAMKMNAGAIFKFVNTDKELDLHFKVVLCKSSKR